MRELFNKAMLEQLTAAKYAVNEIQKQVNIIKWIIDNIKRRKFLYEIFFFVYLI